jgi:hypothetical protein
MGFGSNAGAGINALMQAEAKKRQQMQAQQQAEATTKKLAEDKAFEELQAQQRPGVRVYRQSEQEKRAGVTPASYEGVRDLKTGELLSQYRFDPYAGEAMQKLKEQAFAQGESPWAKLQLQKQQQEQMAGMDQASKQALQAMSQGQAALMRGGLSSGARERMARQGARDLMMSRQGIARQGMGSRLGIQEQDLARKQSLLSDFGNAEQRAQQANIGQLTGDLGRLAQFDANRYNQMMAAYGAEQGAKAQRDAAEASKPRGKK